MKAHPLAVLALLAAACGKDPPRPPAGCRSGAECPAGQICIVSAAGQPGTCAAPPFSVRLGAPATGTRVGAAGVAVSAVVTLAQAGGSPPSSVVLVVGSAEVGPMTLQSTDGVTLTFATTWVPAPGTVGTAVLAALVKTTGGSLASEGVLLPVDTKKPVVTSPFTQCPLAGCSRDSVAVLSVIVQDDHDVTVTAALDLAGPPGTASPTGLGFYGVNLGLGQYAFPFFERLVTATFTATDSFGNATSVQAAPVNVSRLRWVYDGAVPLTGVAVTAGGDVLVGASSSTAQLRSIKPDVGTETWRATLGSAFVVQAPSIAATTAWAGANDGKLYGRELSTGLVQLTCPPGAVTGQPLFTPSIGGTPETIYSAGGAANLYGAQVGTPGTCLTAAGTTDPVTTSAAMSGGKVFVASVNAVGAATIRRFTGALAADGAVTPTDGAVGCAQVSAPLAVTSAAILAACSNGNVFTVAPASLAATRIAALTGAALESPLVFPNGDLLVGTNDRKLHRLRPPSGAPGLWVDAWSPLPDLGAAVTGAAIVAPDAAGVTSYAVTQAGDLLAVDGAGETVWSAPAGALGTFPLSFPNIAPAAAGGLPTLYVGSGEGKLYAVVVDTGLDTASPWPKSHHDVRNTGDAAAPLP